MTVSTGVRPRATTRYGSPRFTMRCTAGIGTILSKRSGDGMLSRHILVTAGLSTAGTGCSR